MSQINLLSSFWSDFFYLNLKEHANDEIRGNNFSSYCFRRKTEQKKGEINKRVEYFDFLKVVNNNIVQRKKTKFLLMKKISNY